MTSGKGDSCLLNLDYKPKEGSITNFILHIATPSHTVGNMFPSRIIGSRNGYLKTKEKIKPVTGEGLNRTLQADQRTKSF